VGPKAGLESLVHAGNRNSAAQSVGHLYTDGGLPVPHGFIYMEENFIKLKRIKHGFSFSIEGSEQNGTALELNFRDSQLESQPTY
jgi:hypothetical protein